ncbi:MAG: hypothetical protein HC945_01155 [Nitrosarchaeum sp.]|nr:hypothetical protein [Nitrosarchaeum sp.]
MKSRSLNADTHAHLAWSLDGARARRIVGDAYRSMVHADDHPGLRGVDVSGRRKFVAYWRMNPFEGNA